MKANPVFTWAPALQAAKYRIEVSTTEAFTTITWKADVFGTTATPVDELPLGSLHWRVASIDSAGVPGVSCASRNLTKGEADPPELTAPANGAKLDYPSDPAVLSWKPVAGIKQYRLELDDESTFTGASTYTTASNSFALPVALPSNAPRFWRVQGVTTNASVATAWSDATDLRSFSIAWPITTVPTLLSPSDSLTVDNDEIDFSWSPVPGATEYEIQTSTAEDFTAHLTTQVTDATRYRPTNTMTQDQYYWRVRARQANGEPTTWSSVSRFKWEWLDGAGLEARPAVSIVDADPTSLGTQLEQGRISATWTSMRRASHYEIDVSSDPAFLSGVIKCATPHTEWTPYFSGIYTGP